MDEEKWNLMIREDVDRIYDRIVMVMNTNYNSDKIIVLVEGKYDKIFYDKFKVSKNAIVFYTRGCEKMNALVEILRHNEYEFIAIQDSDFANLGVENSGMTEMFYTDYHDYEMTCIQNRDVWEKIDSKLDLSSNNVTEQDVMSDIKLLSYYRYCSRTCDYYNGFNVIQHLVDNAVLLDYAFIHNHVSLAHPHSVDIQEGHLNAFIADHQNAETKLYDLCNGHDFLNRIVYKINQIKNHNYYDCDEEEIQEILVDSTDEDDFKKTKLYADIRLWGNSHKQIFV